jgi:hypothetical protein
MHPNEFEPFRAVVRFNHWPATVPFEVKPQQPPVIGIVVDNEYFHRCLVV